MSYTDMDIPSAISDLLTRKRPTMNFERYMKEFAITIQEQGLCQEKYLGQVITGQRYRRMHMMPIIALAIATLLISANTSRMYKCDKGSQ